MIQPETGRGLDRKHIGSPRREEGAFFIFANLNRSKDLTRMAKMFRRMKKVRGADGRCRLLRYRIFQSFLSHSLTPFDARSMFGCIWRLWLERPVIEEASRGLDHCF